jgi:hypothetical protein
LTRARPVGRPLSVSADAWGTARPLLAFFSALLGVAAAFYCLLLGIATAVGGTMAGGAACMGEVLSWTVTVVQLVSQVGQAAAPGLPDATRAAYATTNVFRFQGIALPPSCVGGHLSSARRCSVPSCWRA